MGLATFLFLAITLLSSCNAQVSILEEGNPIRLPTDVGRKPEKINCQSFRVGVEANNIQSWEAPPSYCNSYLKTYLTKKQYTLDIEGVAIAAVHFAITTPLPRDLRPNVWVFDLDDTLLSNLGFFNFSKNNTKPFDFDQQALYKWVASENSTAPALPAIKYLYDAVLALGFKTIIVSEAPKSLSDKRISQLKNAGYDNWDAIIFRGEDENELTNEEFKTKAVKEIVVSEKRYRLIATVGDQWTDLQSGAGRRSFKVPNPMYYTA